ncbi:MAG: threonine synthase, partial [Halobacteriales archaeon]
AQRSLAEDGIGVEPASAASLAGLRALREAGTVDSDEYIVCLTTGHLLKDPAAAADAGTEPEPVPADIDGVLETLG